VVRAAARIDWDGAAQRAARIIALAAQQRNASRRAKKARALRAAGVGRRTACACCHRAETSPRVFIGVTSGAEQRGGAMEESGGGWRGVTPSWRRA